MERGAILPISQCFELGLRWYRDRLWPHWRPKTAADAAAILASVGLTGPFWEMQ